MKGGQAELSEDLAVEAHRARLTKATLLAATERDESVEAVAAEIKADTELDP